MRLTCQDSLSYFLTGTVCHATKSKIAVASGKPQEALEWISKVEKAKSWEELGNNFSSEFGSLQMKIYDGLKKVTNSAIHRKAQIIEDELERKNKFLTGPQLLWLFWSSHKLHEVDTDLIDHNNLMSCHYQHKNLAGFWQAWQLMIKKQTKQQPESLLNHLFRIQIEKDESLAKDLKEY